VSSNDSSRLEIDVNILFAEAERHAADKPSFATVELTPGDHTVKLVMFDRTGTGGAELFFAKGMKTAVDPEFALLGDHRHRPYISTLRSDLRSQLEGRGASVYARIPFQVDNLSNVDGLQLSLRSMFDDGFVAYLNGVEIARHNAPEQVAFNSSATATRPDVDALKPMLIDVSAFREQLRVGRNVLAVQALNAGTNDPDMLFSTSLVAILPNQSIRLSKSTVIKARIHNHDGWSAMAEANFRLGMQATKDDLRITEVHYHPANPTQSEIDAGFRNDDDFEFVEITNISDHVVDLTDVRIAPSIDGNQGISFDFSKSRIPELDPGERIVIVESLDAFRARYVTDAYVAGQWGGALANSSDTISLMVGDQLVQRFTYSDEWYSETDGAGPSLESILAIDSAIEQWELSTSWQPSVNHGTPGRARGPLPGDANRDGLFNTADLLQIFAGGEFEDAVQGNSTWEEGDWDGDGDFTTRDLVFAFSNSQFVGQLPEV
jgi:hypothetical protein